MSSPKEIGHLVLNVSDVDRSVAFYRDVVGFQVTRYRPGSGAFLTCGVVHHNLALSKADPDAPPRQPGQVGLNHFAFKVESWEGLQQAHQRLIVAGAAIDHLSDHDITRSVYFQDPDGITMELYADGFADLAEGLAYIKATPAHANPLDITGPEPPKPEIPAAEPAAAH